MHSNGDFFIYDKYVISPLSDLNNYMANGI